MSPHQNPAELRDQIALTRAELGETLEALAEKTDVGARARRRLEATRHGLGERRNGVAGRLREAAPDSAARAADQVGKLTAERRTLLVLGALLLAGFVLWRLGDR
jgi:hypothetical protein